MSSQSVLSCWRFVVIGLFLLFVVNSGRAEQTIENHLENAANWVVTIDAQFDNRITFGAGLIIGRDSDDLFIATANHVVRQGDTKANKITLKFNQAPTKSVEAVIEEHYDRELDLAVLRVPDADELKPSPCTLPAKLLKAELPVKRGHGVFPIGNPNGVAWQFPIAPDQVTEVNENNIIFQSTVIESGHSGGGLFNAFGDLIGMIKADQPPYGIAIRLSKILQHLQQWDIPLSNSSVTSNDNSISPCSFQDEDSKEIQTDLSSSLAVSETESSVINENRKRMKEWAEGQLALIDENTKGECSSAKYSLDDDIYIRCSYGRNKERAVNVAIRHGDVNQLEKLLESGGIVTQGGSEYVQQLGSLHWAVLAGNAEIVKVLLLRGANVNAYVSIQEPHSRDSSLNYSYLPTPLHLATALEHFDIMKMLIANGADPNKDSNGQLPLSVASKLGFLEAAKILISAGADIHVGENANYSNYLHSDINPMSKAVLNGHIEMIQLFERAGAKLVRESRGHRDAQPYLMSLAALGGQIDTIKYLISKGVPIACQDEENYSNCISPLKVALELSDEPKRHQVIALLLKAGANPNGYRFKPYLISAVGDSKSVELLLKAGANPNFRDSDNKTALTYALQGDKTETARILRAYGATK